MKRPKNTRQTSYRKLFAWRGAIWYRRTVKGRPCRVTTQHGS